MNNNRKTSYNVICVVLFIVCSFYITQAQTESAPDSITFHYNLEVGKILYYTSRGKLEYTKGVMDSKENLEIWVLAQNPDSSWHLLLHNIAVAAKTEGKGKREELPENFGWAFCDFYPNGRHTRNWAMDNLASYDLFLPNIFPPLPGDFSSDVIEWESNDPVYGDSVRYRADKPNLEERSWIVKATYMTPLDEVYSMSQKAEIYIDLIKGVPIYKKEENVRGYGYYAGKSNATVILDSIVTFDPSFATRYAREMEIFLSADSTYSDILSEAENNPAKLALSRSSAEYVLLQTSARITVPEIKIILNQIINQVPEDFEQITEQIKKRTRLVNKPSPKWDAEDFAGEKHSLDDFLGNVILLDFWYRGCPWCIRSMSFIDQVAKYFRGKAVRVLGINTDKEREDAIFVIDKKNPSYINLSGRDLIKKYGVTNYPTFIIIDRNGLVRRILIGYETELTDKLVEIIESLL